MDIQLEFDYGQNLVNKMMQKGAVLNADELICVSFNVNLDYIFRLLKKYPKYKIIIYANSEKITLNKDNLSILEKYVSNGTITINHFSSNLNIIHSKLYFFRKEGELLFISIGSPNMSQNSNQNFESILHIYDKEIINQIWTQFNASEIISIPPLTRKLPESLLSSEDIPEYQLVYLDGLWEHQKNIVSWLFRKKSGIINIPPGTGKTKISINYLKMVFDTLDDYTGIILVPTITLIEQWKKRLSDNGYNCIELENDINSISSYISNPQNKILVTLYSRFFNHYQSLIKQLRIISPNFVIIYDECHNLYGKLDDLHLFKNLASRYASLFELGLSATLDSFKTDEVKQYIEYMGGTDHRYEISLPAFYSNYNNLNNHPILKNINYTPIKYALTHSEMEKFDNYSRKIAMQMGKVDVNNNAVYGAAIQRAQWLRGLEGGSIAIKDYISSNIESFSTKSTIIFVQSHVIAQEIQQFIVKNPGWNKSSSVYIYDSYQNESYREYAIEQFRKNTGFCLISEQMLSEGFDLPKVDMILLHGSHRSERDWIQKIGRAIRFNVDEPGAIAEILDIVFCSPSGLPLNLEKERFRTLQSISM
jgi:superfamily II DNA or RNA helicase